MNPDWNNKFEAMLSAVSGRRVVPPLPPGKLAKPGKSDEATPQARGAGSFSAWSLFIHYRDAKNEETERRVTCKRLVAGFGGDYRVMAFCHERNALRAFLLNRIVTACNVETGEIYDPRDHFSMLRTEGLPFRDDGLATFAKICSFMTKCDGFEHPSERATAENAIGRYALRFGADDRDVEQAIAGYGSLAPDGYDFGKCIAAIKRSSNRKQLARLTIETCADIIDADGVHTDEEVSWALYVSDALKVLAT